MAGGRDARAILYAMVRLIVAALLSTPVFSAPLSAATIQAVRNLGKAKV